MVEIAKSEVSGLEEVEVPENSVQQLLSQIRALKAREEKGPGEYELGRTKGRIPRHPLCPLNIGEGSTCTRTTTPTPPLKNAWLVVSRESAGKVAHGFDESRAHSAGVKERESERESEREREREREEGEPLGRRGRESSGLDASPPGNRKTLIPISRGRKRRLRRLRLLR
jgi:hypothetical protein